MTRWLLIIHLIFASLANASTNEATPAAVYAVHGIVKAIDLLHRRATISHERIADYMEAMTMDFDARDADALQAIHVGDSIDFRLQVKGEEAWIDQLKVVDRDLGGIKLEPAKALAGELEVGAKFPDLAMVDEYGTPKEIKEYCGRVVAVSFIYTRCPLPTYCPLINRKFQTAQSLLKEIGKPKGWELLSVSLDPEYDTPEKLKAFADAQRADANCWLFLNAEPKQALAATRAVGLEFVRKDAQITHNLRTVVLDAKGCIRRIFRGNEWTPQELASEMMSAMRSMKAEAPE